jgi:hypothetical protein
MSVGRAVVVDDVRMPLELATVLSNGFYVVRVEAPLPVRVARLTPDDLGILGDPTETALDGQGFAQSFSSVIVNDGSLGPAALASQILQDAHVPQAAA